MREVNSLNHTRWECKYHIVFIPKYRKKVIVWSDSEGDGRSISSAGEAERKLDRGRSSDAGSCAHDDIDSTEICGISGGWLYQREECDPYSAAVRWQETELCWAALLGSRLFRIDSGPR